MEKRDFEQTYIALYPGLYRLAQSILRHPADAQDAVQQSAVKAWAAADRIRPGGEKAYITRIVINECRNIQRHRQRVLPVDEPRGAGSMDAPDSELKAVIDSLPETLRLRNCGTNGWKQRRHEYENRNTEGSSGSLQIP